MKKPGVIGGIGPESTIAYYRLIVAAGRQRGSAGEYPPVLINSVDVQKVLQLVANNALATLTGYFASEVEALANGGAALGLLAGNTPHIVSTKSANARRFRW
jgi:aspartate racemase